MKRHCIYCGRTLTARHHGGYAAKACGLHRAVAQAEHEREQAIDHLLRAHYEGR